MGSLATELRDELSKLVEPLAAAAHSPTEGWALVVGLVGHPAATAEQPQLRGALEELGETATALLELEDAELASWAGIARILAAGREATEALRALEAAVSDPVLGARLAGFGRELTEQLVGLYLRRHHPRAFRLAALLTIVDPLEEASTIRPVLDGTTVVRGAWVRDELHPDRIGLLLRRPWPTLAEVYLPNGLATAADSHASAGRLFPLLRGVAESAGLSSFSELHRTSGEPAGGGEPPDEPPDHLEELEPDPGDWTPSPALDLTAFHRQVQPRMFLTVPQLDEAGAVAGARVALGLLASSPEHPSGVAGYLVEVFGSLAWEETRGRWKLAVASEGEIPAFVVGPGGLELAPVTAPPPGGSVRLAVERLAAAGEPAFLLGSDTGTRIEVGALRLDGQLELGPTTQSSALTVAATSSRLVIAPEDGDGFLQRALPSSGFGVDFALGVVVSSARGIELTGGAGLDVVLPSHVSLGSAASIDSVALGLAAVDGGIRVRASAAVTLRLGPVAIAIDRLGIEATTTFPEHGGNLGLAELDLGFAGPTGLGLALDLGVVRGTGALFVDPEQGRYLGRLGLAVGDQLSVDLLGLLTTRRPDGQPGFSLLLVGAASFPGIPLGFGFELERAGALVAVHRRLDVPALAETVKAGQLATLLDPGDDIVPAVGGLERILPLADGAVVGGVLLGLTWGEPTLATIDLAFLYDTSSPDRLTAVGTLAMLLPRAEPLLEIHVDVVGVFRADPLSVDLRASLRESKLAGLTLTGDAALQLEIGETPRFLLALGGFHPAFTPPPGFPELRRLALSLPANDFVELSLTGYVAVTSNSVQFGAYLHFWAGIDGVLGVEGNAEFDALVSWAPVHFKTRLKADVKVKLADETLFGAELRGSFEGPGRWHVTGGVYIEVMWWEVKVYSVDTGFGSAPELPAAGAVDPAAEVAGALRSPKSWRGLLEPGAGGVHLSATDGGPDAIFVHPCAALRVLQTRVPLDLELDRIGTAPAGGTRRVALTRPLLDGAEAGSRAVDDFFAMGQFLDLSDDERLARPSFERLPAGLDLEARDAVDPATFARTAELEFETIPAPPQRYRPLDVAVGQLVGAATTGWEAPARPVTVVPPRFAIASTETLEPDAGLTPADGFSSLVLAAQALREALADDPARAPELQVVGL